jgi:proteasome alpha subunit
MKPYEVEILVAQVGSEPGDRNELFHILYDGTVMDEEGFTVLGGQAETISEVLNQSYEENLALGAATKLGAQVLGDGQQTAPPADQLEVALLDRNRTGRTFRRIKGVELEGLLS